VVATVLAESEVVVLATKYEGRPLSLLEGMGAACAVLASDIDALRELLGDSKAGILALNDVNAWADKLRTIATLAPQELHEMCRASREAYEAGATIERQVAATRRLYEDVIRSRES
jgi:glycosyltransferase involved in cell wall biosynthesis